MSQLAQLLKDLLKEFDQKSSLKSTDLPKIQDTPNEEDLLANVINSLLKEGNVHHSDRWGAHMTPETSHISILGQLIAASHNGNLLSAKLYPILAEIEQKTLHYLCQLFGQQYGHFVAGSSYANLEALWQAKQSQATNSRIVYASKSAHYSIVKACQILDLDLRYIASNNDEQLSIAALEQACSQHPPLVIIATVGTTTMGAIDPVSECNSLAKRYDAWCHVDAAWGGALVLLPEYKSLFQSISEADSICFDPHKSWQQPKPASVLLYQQPLSPMLSADSSYLEQSPMNSLPGSRGGELFLPLWLSLIHSGSDSLQRHTQQRLQQAELFVKRLGGESNWTIYPSNTGIVCFRPDKGIDLASLIEQGVLSQADINNEKVYRVVFANAQTTANSLITMLEPYF
ncbi:MAG: aminotransferase class V-fold PLP-dependent enzyme [Piscirickettsiaceae bacterium]|nr:aminotransferase class V-fold PLP-dependent enzyme [Piscirickettsiaceae bacterium]